MDKNYFDLLILIFVNYKLQKIKDKLPDVELVNKSTEIGWIKVEEGLQFAEWLAEENYESFKIENIDRLCERHGHWPVDTLVIYNWWRLNYGTTGNKNYTANLNK